MGNELFMGNTFYFDWEPALMEWLQQHLGNFGATVSEIFTMLGEETVMVLILSLLYWCLDKEFGVFIGTNLMAALTWNPMIKNVALRRRPYFDNPGVKCLRPVEAEADIYDISAQGYSFPSGHAGSSLTLYGSLTAYRKNRLFLAAAIIIPLLVGFSRVFLGVHYPTDVLIGWLLGAVVVALVSFLQRRINERWKLYVLLVATAIPGCLYCHTSDYFSSLGMMIGFFCANLFEEKYVKFENTRSPLRAVLRLIGGLAIFLGLNELLKLPFSDDLLSSDSALAFLIRAIRYAIIVFVDIGIYPMLFNLSAKYFPVKNNSAPQQSAQ